MLLIDRNSANPQAAEFLADIVADAHARLVGAGGPVQITGPQMVNIVRNQSVAELPAVTLPVEEVAILDTIRTSLRWFVPIAALIGLGGGRARSAHPSGACRRRVRDRGVLHPRRGAGDGPRLRRADMFLLPTLSDNLWIDVIPAVANNELRTVAGLSCALAIVGVVLILGSASFRRRKTSWSSPVRVTRYNEQRRWS